MRLANYKQFIAGMFVGGALLGVTAQAGVFHTWVQGDTVAANALFKERSGMQFTSSPNNLGATTKPFHNLTQTVSVLPPDPILPPDPVLPPDPIFTATLLPPDPVLPPDPIRVQILHPESVTLVDSSGNLSQLCPAANPVDSDTNRQ